MEHTSSCRLIESVSDFNNFSNVVTPQPEGAAPPSEGLWQLTSGGKSEGKGRGNVPRVPHSRTD
jgi:hypothetical protein